MKKLNLTAEVLKAYSTQENVIRRTGNSRLNYGRIATMSDQDPD